METKTFSVKDGNLRIEDGYIELSVELNDYKNANQLLASNNPEYLRFQEVYHLPSSLIRKPKSDEELADEYNKKIISFIIQNIRGVVTTTSSLV
jgi:hypothetical protein